MLSVLIPIYNFDIVSLAKTIAFQCKEQDIAFQILCLDDCSQEKYKIQNRKLDMEFGISYIELVENIGRSRIRNRLTKLAQYDNLLFIDCDSEILSESFIKNYLDCIDKAKVIYGGRAYSLKAPKNRAYFLHWKYGRKREALELAKRKAKPYLSFQTNNFMVKREIMLEFPFDETIDQYGYEDLLFAKNLKDERVSIMHIENPLMHVGLENSKSYLQKSIQASETLAILYHSGKITDTRMLKFHRHLKNIGFNRLFAQFILKNSSLLQNNLISKNPKLRYFDLLRYSAFSQKLNDLTKSSSSLL